MGQISVSLWPEPHPACLRYYTSRWCIIKNIR